MKQRRKFSVELKRQVVEELLSGMSTPAQLMRRHDISSGLLYHWKEQYASYSGWLCRKVGHQLRGGWGTDIRDEVDGK